MKKMITQSVKGIYMAFSVFLIFSCSDNSSKIENTLSVKPVSKSKIIIKPPADYADTLLIDFPAAVFYHPDSLQLLKIKATTDSMVYDGSMHEFFYQMRNARMVIKRTWPDLSIVDCKNHRYILFVKEDRSRECIDLDTKNDAYGLFVFNRKKSPLFIDMTNIETEVSFYLKN
jgi:hypothetical protein